jgi:hypothetical protein
MNFGTAGCLVQIHEQVSTHYEDLLQQVTGLQDLEALLASVKAGLASLDASMDKWDSEFSRNLVNSKSDNALHSSKDPRQNPDTPRPPLATYNATSQRPTSSRSLATRDSVPLPIPKTRSSDGRSVRGRRSQGTGAGESCVDLCRDWYDETGKADHHLLNRPSNQHLVSQNLSNPNPTSPESTPSPCSSHPSKKPSPRSPAPAQHTSAEA